MNLFFREFGNSDKKIIIVHGLYGSSDNWIRIAKKLENRYHVFLIDMRNHGRSPKSNNFSYELLASDLYRFIKIQNIREPVLIGHSLGGRAVALCVQKFPEIASKVVFVDISPFRCENENEIINFHKNILQALKKLDFSTINSYENAKVQLKENIKDGRLLNFLLKNIYKSENGKFLSRFNIDSILKNVNKIFGGSLKEECCEKINLKSLFIIGENSNYITNADIEVISKIFKAAEYVKINNAGHWVHVEKEDIFLQKLETFI